MATKIEDVLKEMRSVQLPGLDVTMNAWADAIEEVVQEKDAEIEHLRAKLTECDGKLGKRPCQTGRCMEFVRLREALNDIANRGVPVQREEHRIARAALNTEAVVKESLTTGDTSDGYHTFNELYEHRHTLFLNLMSFNDNDAWISGRHHDGTGFDGWFIAGIELPTGTISYHLPERLWDAAVFTGATVMERAPEWDGHTAADVVSRLYQMVAPYKDLSGEQT